jgi:chromosome segregation ATPase
VQDRERKLEKMGEDSASRLAQAQAQVRGLEGQVGELTARLKSQAADLEAERRKAAAGEAAKQEADTAKRAAQDAEQTLRTAQEQAKTKDAEIARLRAAVQKAADDLSQTKTEKARWEREVETLETEVARLRKRLLNR